MGVAGNLVQYIDVLDVDLFPHVFSFRNTPAEVLGSMASPADGFDGLHALATGNFAAGAAQSAAIEPTLLDSEARGAEVGINTFQGEADQLALDVENGKRLLGEIGIESEPPAPPPDASFPPGCTVWLFCKPI